MNCRPGDLAIIIDNFLNNAGKLVQTKELCQDFAEKLVWECVALQTINSINEGSGQFQQLSPGSTVYSLDSQLRPLRGDTSFDEVAALYQPSQPVLI